MALAAEQGGIDRVFAHAPNTGATPLSNRSAVSTPAAEQPRPQNANNAATGGRRNEAGQPSVAVPPRGGCYMRLYAFSLHAAQSGA